MEQVVKYFNAEKTESVLFILIGIIATFFAACLWIKTNLPFYSGMAYPLLIIAVIQISVGASIYFRSPKDIIRVSNMIEREPMRIKTEEIPRMEVVMKNFKLYRWIEIALMIIGIMLFLLLDDKTLMKGVGIGLLLQSVIMLLLDFFAESRGNLYLQHLKKLI